jgi:hypothetical protein
MHSLPSFRLYTSHLQATTVSVGSVRVGGVVTETERVLRLVNNGSTSASVHVVVLGATELVHGGLGVGLGVVRLRLAGNLVTGAGY